MTEDAKDNKIPKEFQTEHGIGMNLCEETNELLLSANYRKTNSEEFRYFISRMVPAMNPSGHQFLHQRGTKLVSDIFSASDEAYALMVIYNEKHRWDANIENENGQQDGQKEIKLPKRFNFSKSGQKDSWSVEGRKLFGKLHKEITKRRVEEKTNGSRLEEEIRNMYAQIDNLKDKQRPSKINLSGQSEKIESFVPADIAAFLNTTNPTNTKSLEVSYQDNDIQEL